MKLESSLFTHPTQGCLTPLIEGILSVFLDETYPGKKPEESRYCMVKTA